MPPTKMNQRQITGTVPMITPPHPRQRTRKSCTPRLLPNPGALLNKGSRRPPTPTAERQRAGKVSTTASLHPRRPSLNQASLPNGSPGPGPRPRGSLGTFHHGKVPRPQAKLPPSPPQAEFLTPQKYKKVPLLRTSPREGPFFTPPPPDGRGPSKTADRTPAR